jgi:hypothetical protein
MGAREAEPESPAFSTSPHMTQHGGDDNGAEIPKIPDRVKLSGDTTSYTNSSHWTSKLIDILSSLVPTRRLTASINV